VKFGFIAKHRGIWPAEWLCEALPALQPFGLPWGRYYTPFCQFRLVAVWHDDRTCVAHDASNI
jgi:hypothetical protein